jgi:hypothetical protein
VSASRGLGYHGDAVLELVLVVLLLGGLLAIGGLSLGLSFPHALVTGSVAIGVGLGGALIVAWRYHLALRAGLSQGGAPPRWWLSPTSFHDRLQSPHRERVRLWHRIGIATMSLFAAGCVVVLFSTLRQM